MAGANTTLNGAVTSTATQIKLTAFTNPSSGTISAPTVVMLDGNEQCLVTDTTNAPTLGVARGWNGTQATAHGTLAPVAYGLTSDFNMPSGVSGAMAYSYGADATFTNPLVDSTVYITKATAIALTITDPTFDNVAKVRFISTTAAAHLLTYATGWYDNTTTSDVATFPATAGATFTMQAISGKWRPVSTADDGVTLA